MTQPHNRQMSFSLYISALAVSDTVVLIMGKMQQIRLKNFPVLFLHTRVQTKFVHVQ